MFLHCCYRHLHPGLYHSLSTGITLQNRCLLFQNLTSSIWQSGQCLKPGPTSSFLYFLYFFVSHIGLLKMFIKYHNRKGGVIMSVALFWHSLVLVFPASNLLFNYGFFNRTLKWREKFSGDEILKRKLTVHFFK